MTRAGNGPPRLLFSLLRTSEWESGFGNAITLGPNLMNALTSPRPGDIQPEAARRAKGTARSEAI